MPFERRDSSGNAAETTLITTVGPSDMTLTILDSSGWPTGGLNGPFFGTVETEVIKFSLRNGTLLTVDPQGRGWDSTLAATHQAGAGITHVFTRTDGDEANYAVSQSVGQITGAGQSFVGTGTNQLGIVQPGTEGQFYKIVSGSPAWDTLDSTDMSDFAAATDTAATVVAQAQIRAMIQAGADITVTDNGTVLTIAVPTLTERVQDVIGALVSSTNLSVTYDDGAGTLVINFPTNLISPTYIPSPYQLVVADTAFPTPVDGQRYYDTTNKLEYICSGTNWVCVTPVTAFASGSVSTTDSSAAGVGLSGGPAVTVHTNTTALVTVGCNISNSTIGDGAAMGCTVSGATTIANTGDTQVYVNHVDSGDNYTISHTFQYTALTPGTNTFTAAYHTNGAGTGVYSSRKLTVVGIP